MRRICIKNELLKGKLATAVIPVRAGGGSGRLMALFLAVGSISDTLSGVCVIKCGFSFKCRLALRMKSSFFPRPP